MKLRAFINMEKINWTMLSGNPAPNAIKLLETNPEKINWYMMSGNPSAIHLLEANPTKINWKWLSVNPAIFEYDYQAMKDRMYNSGLFEGLMMNRFHPRNIPKFEEWGHEGIF